MSRMTLPLSSELLEVGKPSASYSLNAPPTPFVIVEFKWIQAFGWPFQNDWQRFRSQSFRIFVQGLE
eukprot:6128592-Pyramimonas_sp.AAC.2